MTEFTEDDVRLEKWAHGPLFVADSEEARVNKAMMERHFLTEWNGDIEATMATIHPRDPWQRIPAFGVDVNGFDAVREYYLSRFNTWPGPAMDHFDRVIVTDDCIHVEGKLAVQPRGGVFGGAQTDAKLLSAPCVIVIDFKEGLVLGETVYVDSATLKGETSTDG